MFGLIISGRPVDATPQVFSEAQYAFRIAPTPSFSHVVVFLLPGAQLPPGTAASVYIQIPPSQEFKLLGGIGPGKESAIFKVSGVKAGPANAADGDDMDAMVDDASGPANNMAAASGEIVIGLSIEPAAQVEAQLLQLKGAAALSGQQVTAHPSSALVRLNSGTGGRITTKVLAQRIIGNAFDFLASFGSDTVPLKAFRDWWLKFEKKSVKIKVEQPQKSCMEHPRHDVAGGLRFTTSRRHITFVEADPDRPLLYAKRFSQCDIMITASRDLRRQEQETIEDLNDEINDKQGN
ncbi:hypothetical protein LTR78_002284 [Recurvomyces mirabilis]|uniref:Hikeshi-like domain-containing protein n=1 Tax=Recurvomyces mirabilis TaxID=574656 RepID=A0AAE0WUB3_9PEZI|nr:hypothetical protein LTR78_002284 [Recurvomyces mirabilis]KAK5160739.1 hypothetical protein LTS14_001752 [Recurvomyces mirabilis]